MRRVLLLVLCGFVLGLLINLPLQADASRCDQPRLRQPLPDAADLESVLPEPLSLPLPASLSSLPSGAGYLDQVLPSRYGYLRWAAQPICLYIQPAEAGTTAAAQRTRQWVEAVTAAAETWSRYLTLQRVDSPDQADILVQRRSPPLRRTPEGRLAPARTAEAVFHLFLEPAGPGQEVIQPQFSIDLGSQQGPTSLQQTALHELGHALGLWGHSPDPLDVMVDRQTPHTLLQPSARDLATLRQLYEQPSRLGQPFSRGNLEQRPLPMPPSAKSQPPSRAASGLGATTPTKPPGSGSGSIAEPGVPARPVGPSPEPE